MNHQLFQNYCRQNLSADERANLHALCKEHPAVQLFIDLIDICKKKSADKRADYSISLSDDDIELLLIRILADNIHKKDAKNFLNGLDDPLFFDKVMTVLQIAATPVLDTVDEMSEIRIQTSQEIFKRLKPNKPEPGEISLVKRLIDKLGNTRLAWKRAAVPAMVLAAFGLVIFLPYQLQPPNTFYVKYLDNTEKAIHIQNPAFNFLQGTRTHADSFGPNGSLIARYKNAFGHYLIGDYKSALKKFNDLENKVNALDKSKANAYLQSEYYFYSGQCHLHLAGNRGRKKKHLDNAIDDFSISLDIAQSFSFDHKLQVPFFLALAYQMNGEHDQASRILTEFSVSPQYSADAERLKSID